MKVWFQNRRTKHKREETETDQAKALGGGRGAGRGGGRGAKRAAVGSEEQAAKRLLPTAEETETLMEGENID